MLNSRPTRLQDSGLHENHGSLTFRLPVSRNFFSQVDRSMTLVEKLHFSHVEETGKQRVNQLLILTRCAELSGALESINHISHLPVAQ